MTLWNLTQTFSSDFIKVLEQFGSKKVSIPDEYHIDSDFTWVNHVYEHDRYRRAHVEILDAREKKKIWVMHATIFPHLNDPSPIFGFDIVVGQNKITGAFHDYSKMGECPLYYWYQEKMKTLSWSKPRILPPWAKEIFSPGMLAAGNIQADDEVRILLKTAIDNLDNYLYNIDKVRTDETYIEQFNKYCRNQKMNPHTPAMMETLGIDKDLFRKFMDDVLFPEYNG